MSFTYWNKWRESWSLSNKAFFFLFGLGAPAHFHGRNRQMQKKREQNLELFFLLCQKLHFKLSEWGPQGHCWGGIRSNHDDVTPESPGHDLWLSCCHLFNVTYNRITTSRTPGAPVLPSETAEWPVVQWQWGRPAPPAMTAGCAVATAPARYKKK